jgi:hypothetical protein
MKKILVMRSDSLYYASRRSDSYRATLDIAIHNGVGADHCAFTNCDSGTNNDTLTQPSSAPDDDGGDFVETLVHDADARLSVPMHVVRDVDVLAHQDFCFDCHFMDGCYETTARDTRAITDR